MDNGYTPDSSAPGDTTLFQVPGGLWIKAKTVERVPDGLLIDGDFYPFSLWGMVDNTRLEEIKAESREWKERP
jgi:hypothetical protein